MKEAGGTNMLRILLVDDDPASLELSKDYLEIFYEIEVDTACSAGEAIPKLRTGTFDAVVSDYRMPGMDGITFLKTIREKGIGTPFILFTGAGKEDVLIRALESGASFYLQKGKEPKALYAELSEHIQEAVGRKTQLNTGFYPITG